MVCSSMGLEGFPYSVLSNTLWWADQFVWIHDHIGEAGVDWQYHKVRWYFKREQDKVLFLLKWSNNVSARSSST